MSLSILTASINGAVRKIRQALKDDPQQPRYVETLSGRGYRVIAPVFDANHVPAPLQLVAKPQPSRNGVHSAAFPRRTSEVVLADPTGPTNHRTHSQPPICVGDRDLLLLCHRTRRLVCVATLLRHGRDSIHSLHRSASPAKPLRRSGPGLFRRWHDRRTDHGAFSHSVIARHLPHLCHGIQRHPQASSANCPRTWS